MFCTPRLTDLAGDSENQIDLAAPRPVDMRAGHVKRRDCFG